MKRKWMSIFVLISMVISMAQGIFVYAADNFTVYFLPESFRANLGTWQETTYFDSYDGKILFGKSDANVGIAKPAIVNVDLPQDGSYYVWARTRDYETDSGTRTFAVQLGDTKLDTKLGNHGSPGWQWQLAGKVEMKKGQAAFSIIDNTARFARTDVLCITTDSGYTPPNDAGGIKNEVNKYLFLPSINSQIPAQPVVSASASPSASTEKNGYFAYFGIDAFKDSLGSWIVEDASASQLPPLYGENLRGLSDHNISSAKNAVMKFQAPLEGEYFIWVHSRDFDSMPGTRNFKVKVGDELLEQVLGKNGQNGWAWEFAGSIQLESGEMELALVDTKAYLARLDAILITTDEAFVPPNENLKQEFEAYQYNGKMIAEGKLSLVEEMDLSQRPKSEIAVSFNGKWLVFDVEPVIVNNRTMVPFRAIFEELGCAVSWNEKNETATGERNGMVVELPIGDKNVRINGKVTELDQEAMLMNGRTLVPLRFVTQAFGGVVKWDEATKSVGITAKIPKAAFFLRPESFEELGTWILEANLSVAYNTSTLRGMAPTPRPDGKDATADEERGKTTKPATSTIHVVEAGEYKVWVHARDYKTNQPGTRYFKVGIDEYMFENTFGTHKNDGFLWQEAGVITLEKGKHQVKLFDTAAFYGRCDGILITADIEMTPPEDYQAVTKIALPIDRTQVNVSFPVWAKSTVNPVEAAVLENDYLKVSFFEVGSSQGNFIKKETVIKQGGYKVEGLDDNFGYLLLRALQSEKSGYDKEFTVYKQQYEIDGEIRSSLTSDIYKTGDAKWLIPRDVTVVSDNEVVLYFECEFGDFSSTWVLNSGEKEPKVTVNFTAHKEGSYSIGAFSGPSVADEDYEFALLPYRIQSKRVPEETYLITEMFAFTPMASITLPKENKVTGGAVTYGLVVEPDWIPLRWVYRDNAKFGLALRNYEGNIQPSVFAPLFGSQECKFDVGQSYSFQYRPTYTSDGWYENYLHIAKDLFEVTDYRSNTYSNLNTAIFNARDLMMDDDFGGWDPKAMAHYNMEGRNITSNANPVEAVQIYMLTEDEEILRNRTVPTIANLLSRKDFHFYYGGSLEGGGTFFSPSKITAPYEIGTPITNYKTDVLGGIYEMSGGRMPYLLDYGIKVGESQKENITYGRVTSFVNDVAMYKYTKDAKYLENAKKVADKYLEAVVYKPQTAYVDWTTFAYINQYPSLASLLDIYEATGEQKYLDAAIETGRWLTTCLWVPGLNGKKGQQDMTLTPEEITSVNLETGGFSWWHGDQKWRLGTPDGSPGYPQDFSALQTETVKAWVPSRVGLGLEQTSTFGTSKNIYMSSWAGDLLRLAKLSGEDYFEASARNAIVGRFGNYPGYYIGRFLTIQMKENYPWEGPDFTSIFYHHLPPFLAMIEEFLITQAWSWSDKNIEFPSTRQYGYAYFDSNQFGSGAGKFYDEKDMWLWLDRGIMEADSVQIDWIAAKKDGMLGLSLMNQDSVDITTTVTLGEKVAHYSGRAVVYTSGGEKSQMDIENGRFTITIPAKGMKSVTIAIVEIKKPGYARDYSYSTDIGQSVSDHGNGRGYVIQLSDDRYFAYVYATDLADKTQKVTLAYTIGGGEQKTVVSDSYPFEFIIEVAPGDKEFTYSLTVIDNDGTTKTTQKCTLKPVK